MGVCPCQRHYQSREYRYCGQRHTDNYKGELTYCNQDKGKNEPEYGKDPDQVLPRL